jgi:predicted permease
LARWSGLVLVGVVSRVLPTSLEVAIDGPVLAFTVLASLSTALLCALLPALRAGRMDPLPLIKAGAGAERGTGRMPWVRALVVNQMAVSLVLLVGAGLLMRSLMRLGDIDLGFEPERVLVLRVTPPAGEAPASPDELRAWYRRLLARAESIPGVEAASASSVGLFTSASWGNAITVEGFVPPGGATPRTFANLVTPKYFDVMGIPVLRGRGFTEDDRADTPHVVVVNRTFARRFLGEAEPIGKRVGLCSSDPCAVGQAGMREIVGVAGDLKYARLREEARPMLYVPVTQHADSHLHELEVRTAAAPAAVAGTLYRELSGAEPGLAIAAVAELRDRVDDSIVAERLLAKLSAVFGLATLGLAGVGLYGVVAYATAQRAGEIGIRMALGAGRRDVRRLVRGDTLRLVAIAALIGLPVAMATARLLGSQLYEVKPHDPLVIAVALATLGAAAALAGYLPAWRASRVDPVVALRAE